MQTLDRGKSRDMTYGRGARHWQEYCRTSELKYGIWNLHKFCFRVRTCISVYYLNT